MLAQDFTRHGHDPLGCDLVLSYYQDREMIGDVPVLALQSIFLIWLWKKL